LSRGVIDKITIYCNSSATKTLGHKEKILCFFRDHARKKWPLRGSRIIENPMTRVKGFSVQVSVPIISFPLYETLKFLDDQTGRFSGQRRR